MTLDVRQLLLSAASSGRTEEIRFLIVDGGVDVNVESRSGTTALHYAAMQGKLDTVRLLLSFGASINHKNSTGWTALHYSAHQGHIDVSRLLLDKGADLFAKRNDGKTPVQLMQVAQKTAASSSSSSKSHQRDAMSKWHLCQAMQNTQNVIEKLIQEHENHKTDMSKLRHENMGTSKDLERHIDQHRMDVVYLQEKLRGAEREMESIKVRLVHLEQGRETEPNAEAAAGKSVSSHCRQDTYPAGRPIPIKLPSPFLVEGGQSSSNFAGFQPLQQQSLPSGATTTSNLALKEQQLLQQQQEQPQQQFFHEGANNSRSNLEVLRVQSLPQLHGGTTTSLRSSFEIQKGQPQPQQPRKVQQRQRFFPEDEEQKHQEQPPFIPERQVQHQQQDQQQHFSEVPTPMSRVNVFPKLNSNHSKTQQELAEVTKAILNKKALPQRNSASNSSNMIRELVEATKTRSIPLQSQQQFQQELKTSSNLKGFQPQGLRHTQNQNHHPFSPGAKSWSTSQHKPVQPQRNDATKSSSSLEELSHAKTWRRVPRGSGFKWVQQEARAHSLSPQLLRRPQPPKQVQKQPQQQYKGKEDKHSSQVTNGMGVTDELRQRLVAIQQLHIDMQQQMQQQLPNQQQNQRPCQQRRQSRTPLQPSHPPAYDDEESDQFPLDEEQQQRQQQNRSKTLSSARRPKGWRFMKKNVPRLLCSSSNISEGSYGSGTRRSIGNLVHL